MNYQTEFHQEVEKMYFSGENSISDIANKFDMTSNYISSVINKINEKRKAEKISPADEIRYLEEKLFEAIRTEQKEPTIENKIIIDNLQDIYCKKIMY